ncbi:MAG TPA: YigZ family protein [Azoarcus sp.]|nr:YigZ family protein [Azoarcus sp.]
MALTLETAVRSELLIKKSRFIACVEPMASREAATARVAELRAEHPAARHVCWALLAGGKSAANDDGEPGGTAGLPMLRVLMHHELDGVLATVVRYFGGVKLGAGGLVRAYAGAVAQALTDAHKIELRSNRSLRCEIPYELEGVFRRELAAAHATLDEAVHAAAVELRFTLPEDDLPPLLARLEEAGQGRVRWIEAEDEA